MTSWIVDGHLDARFPPEQSCSNVSWCHCSATASPPPYRPSGLRLLQTKTDTVDGSYSNNLGVPSISRPPPHRNLTRRPSPPTDEERKKRKEKEKEMPLLHSLLRATAFRTPLLGTLVPTVALAYGIQTAVAVPSIAAQTERFYDLSGSLTYLSCTALSFFLPYLRARTAQPFLPALSHYFAPPAPGQRLWWWRHAVLSAAVAIWATRRRHHPIPPSTHLSDRL